MREQLQSMKDDWMKEMKIMIKKEMKDDFIIEMKTIIKEEMAIEKESLSDAVEKIKLLKKYVDKAINFMNEKIEILYIKLKS